MKASAKAAGRLAARLELEARLAAADEQLRAAGRWFPHNAAELAMELVRGEDDPAVLLAFAEGLAASAKTDRVSGPEINRMRGDVAALLERYASAAP